MPSLHSLCACLATLMQQPSLQKFAEVRLLGDMPLVALLPLYAMWPGACLCQIENDSHCFAQMMVSFRSRQDAGTY